MGGGRFFGTKSDGGAFFLTTVTAGLGGGGAPGAAELAPAAGRLAPAAAAAGGAGRPGRARRGNACRPPGRTGLRSSTSPSSSLGFLVGPCASAAAAPFGRLSSFGLPTTVGPGRRECAAPSEGSYADETSSGAACDLTTGVGAARTTGGAKAEERKTLASACTRGDEGRVSSSAGEGGEATASRDAPCGTCSSPRRRRRACPSTG